MTGKTESFPSKVTEAEHRLLVSHGAQVTGIVFSPDCSTVVTSGSYGDIIVWDVPTRSIRMKLSHYHEPILSIAISPSGKLIASANIDGVIVWDSETGELVRHFTSLGCKIAFPSEKSILAEVPFEDQLALAEIDSNNVNLIQIDNVTSNRSFGLSPDGRFAAIPSDNGLDILSVNDPTDRHNLAVPDHILQEQAESFWLEDIVFSPDNSMVAGVGLDFVRIWNVPTRTYMGTVPGDAAAFTSDNTIVAIGQRDGLISLHNPHGWQTVATIQTSDAGISALAFSPDDSLLVTGDNDGRISFWDWRTGKRLPSTAANIRPVCAAGFLADGVSISTDRQDIRRLANMISPDGKIIAIPDQPLYGGLVRLVDLKSGVPICKIEHRHPEGELQGILSAAFSPDSKLMALGHDGFCATIWDTQAGEMIHHIRTKWDSVGALAFSPDGKSLAVGTDYNPLIQIFSTITGKEKRQLIGHRNAVTSLTYSPDGKMLLSSSTDGSVRLWNPRNGNLMKTMILIASDADDDAPVESIAIDRNGVITCSTGAEAFVRDK
jgi:WD40 repeat protein